MISRVEAFEARSNWDGVWIWRCARSCQMPGTRAVTIPLKDKLPPTASTVSGSDVSNHRDSLDRLFVSTTQMPVRSVAFGRGEGQ